MSAIVDSKKPVVGIFAIQGAVEEHADLVKKCGGEVKEVNIMTSLTKSLRRNYNEFKNPVCNCFTD